MIPHRLLKKNVKLDCVFGGVDWTKTVALTAFAIFSGQRFFFLLSIFIWLRKLTLLHRVQSVIGLSTRPTLHVRESTRFCCRRVFDRRFQSFSPASNEAPGQRRILSLPAKATELKLRCMIIALATGFWQWASLLDRYRVWPWRQCQDNSGRYSKVGILSTALAAASRSTDHWYQLFIPKTDDIGAIRGNSREHDLSQGVD